MAEPHENTPQEHATQGASQDGQDQDVSINMDSALDSISSGLGFGEADKQLPTQAADGDATPPEETDSSAQEEPEPQKSEAAEGDDKVDGADKSDGTHEPIRVPSSWAKEHHEDWSKLPRSTQEYITLREKQMLDGLSQYKEDAGFGRGLKEIINPYSPLLEAQGVNAEKAVKTLLNAHYKLSTASPEERANYFAYLAKSYGIDTSSLPAQAQAQADPQITALQKGMEEIKNQLSAGQRAALQAETARWEKEVDTFASDPAHPYFEEVADDIVKMIEAGEDLTGAYEKAVWANPVTREKEIARINKENEAKLRGKAKAETEAAKKAASGNVKSRDTNRTPTEPLGTMEDTLRSTLTDIKSRAS